MVKVSIIDNFDCRKPVFLYYISLYYFIFCQKTKKLYSRAGSLVRRSRHEPINDFLKRGAFDRLFHDASTEARPIWPKFPLEILADSITDIRFIFCIYLTLVFIIVYLFFIIVYYFL